ncbi:MAG: BrnT family toxin [Polyangiaceae bacterium]|nr:BrnT family toxin [Polyangiaceae bacterium]
MRRHRVSFEEATTVFADPWARLHDDPDHSSAEKRFLLVGHSLSNRLLLVVHAERADKIRITSARRLTRGEREDYENDA